VRIFKHLNKTSRIQYFYIFKNYYVNGGHNLLDKLKMLMTGKYKVFFFLLNKLPFFLKKKKIINI